MMLTVSDTDHTNYQMTDSDMTQMEDLSEPHANAFVPTSIDLTLEECQALQRERSEHEQMQQQRAANQPVAIRG
jgi:hypothetical protein